MEENYIGVEQDTNVTLRVTLPAAMPASASLGDVITHETIEVECGIGEEEYGPLEGIAPRSAADQQETGSALVTEAVNSASMMAARRQPGILPFWTTTVSPQEITHDGFHAMKESALTTPPVTMEDMSFLTGTIARILSPSVWKTAALPVMTSGILTAPTGTQQEMVARVSGSISQKTICSLERPTLTRHLPAVLSIS